MKLLYGVQYAINSASEFAVVLFIKKQKHVDCLCIGFMKIINNIIISPYCCTV